MILPQYIIHLSSVNSTNVYAKEMKELDETPDGTVIWADAQTAGIGRGRNTWKSEDGKNLTFSMIVHPHFLPIDFHFYLSKIVSVAMVDFLARYVEKIKIKWPNDIYVEDKKIAGILIENKIVGNKIKNCIIGIGMNINQEVFHADLTNPVSLKGITGKTYNLKSLIPELIDCLSFRYQQLKTGNYADLDRDYDSCLYRKNELTRFVKSGEAFRATIREVSKDGYLVVEKESSKRILLDFGEIGYGG